MTSSGLFFLNRTYKGRHSLDDETPAKEVQLEY